jgi:TonB family protein
LSSTGSSDAPTANASAERRRLTHALLLSLLIHTWVLSLTFGGQGLWLPGSGFPWQDRRIEVPDLRVVVVPAQVTTAEPAVTPVAEPSQQGGVEQPVASWPAPTPSVSRAPPPRRTAAAIVPQANPRAEVNSRTDAATGAAPAQTPLRADRPGDTAPPPIPAPAMIALPRTDEATGVAPAAPAMPPPVIAAAPSVPIPETPMPSPRDAGDAARARIDQEARERAVELPKLDPSKQEEQRQAARMEAARQDAARQEAVRAENARLEAERQEAAREAADLQAAARQEAARQEAERQAAERKETERKEAERTEGERKEAERTEAERTEAERKEAERKETERKETERKEAERKEAERTEAERTEAERKETERKETERKEAARQAAERKEAERKETERKEAERKEVAQVEVAQDAAARREAALRAIGRQLDEEAARRESATAAARLSPSLAPSWSPARRYRLWGRTDPNAEIILYAEAWERKIQLNMTFDMVREVAKLSHTDPMVTVAIRSDGSVESVTIVQSSGVAALDEAIRRVVHSQRPYQAFPPGLAREFDVIEIRRTWYFDMAIRLY